jgi:hypothetical protein
MVKSAKAASGLVAAVRRSDSVTGWPGRGWMCPTLPTTLTTSPVIVVAQGQTLCRPDVQPDVVDPRWVRGVRVEPGDVQRGLGRRACQRGAQFGEVGGDDRVWVDPRVAAAGHKPWPAAGGGFPPDPELRELIPHTGQLSRWEIGHAGTVKLPLRDGSHTLCGFCHAGFGMVSTVGLMVS